MNEFTDEEHKLDYEQKSTGLENILWEMHYLVGHTIIQFSVLGAVDLYYLPNHIKGTWFATMELLEPDGTEPLPNRVGTYELVAFTKHNYNNSENKPTPFNIIEIRVCGFFTPVGFYSREAVLNPYYTFEVPNGNEENICLIFDLYEPENKKNKIGDMEHYLLLCLEVFRSEMDFARENLEWITI